MTTLCLHQQISDNWKKYLDSLEKRINESAVYQFTGTPTDPDNPNSKWDPKSIKKTFIVKDPEETSDELDKIEKETLLEKLTPVLIAAGGFLLLKAAGGWALKKLIDIGRWVGGIGSRLLGISKGAADAAAARTAALTGRGSLVGLVRAGLTRLLGVATGFAVVTAVGYSIWQVYKLANPKAAEAVENKKGPGTQEYVDDIEKGKVSMNIRSWKKASDSAAGRKLQCSWCRSNPGREFPTIKMDKGSWAAVGEMPEDLKKLYYDIKENGPLCKDILKRDDCLKSTKSGLQTQAVSNSDLSGQVTKISNIGIEHNLTGERKRIAELYVDGMMKLGITNKYVLAGALAVSGKESGFLGKAEGSSYGFQRLRNKKAEGNIAVANRTRAVFRHQLGREPNDEEWRQLSNLNGRKGGIALFNIAYGYKSLGKGVYTTYQEEKAIPHSVRVISAPGVINPALFNPELAGYKYRGRGNIQITFKENYRRTAALAGLDVQQIVDNPDLLIQNPEIGVLMNAARTKGSYNKTANNLQKYGLSGNPTNLLDGIKFMAMLAGGGGGNPNNSWFSRAVSRAVAQANKHIRITGESIA